MIGVKKRSGESIEGLLSRFNARVYSSGVLMEYMENQYYTKPSTKKREAKKRAKFLEKIRQRNTY